MCRWLSVVLLLVLTIVPQACERDEATAPRFSRPNAALNVASTSSIAFTRTQDGNADIYVMQPDGSAPRRLTVDPASDGSPTWSPHARQIAFTSTRDGNSEIYVMNADGSAPTRLTNNPAADVEPSWSPNGKRIAFTSNRDGNEEIYVMNADGSAPTRLTNNPAPDRSANWSPDSRQIAFVSFRDGPPEIYVMAADGSAQTRLTSNAAFDLNPSWSPDGVHIAFNTDRDGNYEIYVMNADGSSQTRLTNESVGDRHPSWSPDGRQIAFMRGNIPDDIYVMKADGSAPMQLTSSPGSDGEPSWSPTVASRAPADLTFTAEPPTGVWANRPISPAVQVRVTDASGDAVSGGAVRLAIGTSPSADATLSGTTVAMILDGVATFPDVRIDQLGRGYTLLATAGQVSAISARFAVVEPATHLAFVTQPPSSVEGETVMPPVRVAIQDSLGNALTHASAPVTLALAANPTGATLLGTTTVETADGIATFADLRMDELGSGYTFAVTAPGRATATSTPFAVQVTFAFVDAGTRVSCGVTTQGGGYCWGDNLWGYLGSGKGGVDATPRDPVSWPSPLPVSGGRSFTTASAGRGAAVCGVTTSGAGYCWGFGIDGERGDGRVSRSTNTPQTVLGGLTFTTISAGGSHTCAVTSSGAAYCWGSGTNGQLGIGRFVFQLTSPSTPVAGGFNFTTVSAGVAHTCGVTASGAAYCWGSNGSGQLGDGTTTLTYGPVAVAGGLSFATISAGGSHSCGVTTDGTAYCWGRNSNGQLGDGTSTQQAAPVRVARNLQFATISAGTAHTCGVTTNGDAYCWGANPDGRLGDGSTTQALTPVGVAGGLTFATVRAGDSHSCGVTTSREAYCWGANGVGQLGNGTTTASSTPVPVITDGGGQTVAAATAGPR